MMKLPLDEVFGTHNRDFYRPNPNSSPDEVFGTHNDADRAKDSNIWRGKATSHIDLATWTVAS